MSPQFQFARRACAVQLAEKYNKKCPQALKRFGDEFVMSELESRWLFRDSGTAELGPPKNRSFSANYVSAVARCLLAGLLLAVLLFFPVITRGQDAPSRTVGRVQGKDISIEGGTAADNGGATAASSMYVANGSIVTVHSGHARMTLFAGGEVEICGPAKFTVLVSGDAITLALNFGRIHMALPAKTALRVFTPAVIGTPLDIGGAARDVTVGLNLDDSLCVLATSGAIQLEHQFTGEKLIVPEAGEFFLNGEKLLPVAGTPGSCQCTADEPIPASPATTAEFAVAVPSSAAPTAAPAEKSSAAAPAPQSSAEYEVLAHANGEHPVAPPAKDSPAAPLVSVATDTAVAPALTFSANSTVPPPRPYAGPSPDMIVLIREAQVSPEYEFSGHVAAPEFAQAMQNALGEKAAAPPAQTPADPPADASKKKKGGFWSAVKRAFGH